MIQEDTKHPVFVGGSWPNHFIKNPNSDDEEINKKFYDKIIKHFNAQEYSEHQLASKVNLEIVILMDTRQ